MSDFQTYTIPCASCQQQLDLVFYSPDQQYNHAIGMDALCVICLPADTSTPIEIDNEDPWATTTTTTTSSSPSSSSSSSGEIKTPQETTTITSFGTLEHSDPRISKEISISTKKDKDSRVTIYPPPTTQTCNMPSSQSNKIINSPNFVSVVNTVPNYMEHLIHGKKKERNENYPSLARLPLLGVSTSVSTEDQDQFHIEENMFVIMNELRQIFKEHEFQQQKVLRLCDFYISKNPQNTNELLFQVTVNYQDSFAQSYGKGAAIESMNEESWKIIKEKSETLYNSVRSKFTHFVTLARPYFINLIKKHYLLPEIMNYINNVGMVRIQVDHYTGRESLSQPIFGFHKDTYSCNTFRAVLSFRNNEGMYGAEIMQCHTSLGDRESDRCDQVLRFKLHPRATISFNDYLLAHSSPSCIGSPYQYIPAEHKYEQDGQYFTTAGREKNTITGEEETVLGVDAAITSAAKRRGYKNPGFVARIKADDSQRGRQRVGSNTTGRPLTYRPEFFRLWFEIIQPENFTQFILPAHKKVFNEPSSFTVPISELLLDQNTWVVESNNTGNALRALLSKEMSHHRCGGKRARRRRKTFLRKRSQKQKKRSRRRPRKNKKRRKTRKQTKRKTFLRKRSQKQKKRSRRKTFLRKRSQKQKKRKRRRRKTLK